MDVPYEQTRSEIRELLQKTFGIDTENEITARVDPRKRVDTRPREPLFADGGTDFHAIGVPVSEGRELRIQSKPYNKSWWNNYSKSGWRIIDGSRLFGKACSLVVVSRTDRSREWVLFPPGIPLPFKLTGETTLVTQTEIKVIETFLKTNGHPKAQYYAVPNPYYDSNALIDLMTVIRDAAKALP